jgi:gliding motility-associated-like protein
MVDLSFMPRHLPIVFGICWFLSCTPVFSQTPVTAIFTVPDKACVNSPVQVVNGSTGFTSCYWSFCAADFSTTPEATNLGNPGGLLDLPVFTSFELDDNGNFYGFVVSYVTGDLIRLNFGNSLLNSPGAEDMGTFGGVIPEQAEGIQVLRINGNWILLIVGGGNSQFNSSPRIIKLDFGNSLANTPAATNWGNVGGLNLPHDLYITNEAGNYYGFAINVTDNTLTRFSFGPDFTNPPTGINMGNIGNIDYPAGFTFVKYNSNWFAFIANRLTNSLTRLSFGTSLMNTPTGVNIGNPQNSLDYPRDISLFATCDAVYGFVVNENSNDLVKLNFGTDPTTAAPQATNLGNIGSLAFPHSISDFFRVGNDIYAFIPNVNTNTLTRIRFAGCQDINGSTLTNPPPVTYTQAGNYNINLLVDLGLPTQTSFCRQITVNPSPSADLTGDTVCAGQGAALKFEAQTGTAPFTIQYDDGTTNYDPGGLSSPASIPIPLLQPGNATITLQTISDANGCTATPNSITHIGINPLPVLQTNPDINACGETPVQLAAKGALSYTWTPSLPLDDAGKADPIATVDKTTTFVVKGTDANDCSALDSTTVHVTRNYLLVVPNAFTPNGDGHNDCFGIQHWNNVTVEEFSVYNRLGLRVFATQNPGECWDGRFNGQIQPSGGYVYVIKARSTCGEITRTGMVMLVR